MGTGGVAAGTAAIGTPGRMDTAISTVAEEPAGMASQVVEIRRDAGCGLRAAAAQYRRLGGDAVLHRTLRGTYVVATSLLVLVSLAMTALAAEQSRGMVLGLRELDDSTRLLQGFYFGYRLGPWVPVVGYDRLHIGGDLTVSESGYWTSGASYTLTVSGTAHMPWGGIKYFYKAPSAGKAAPYAMVSVGKPMAGVKLDLSGSVSEQERDEVKDLERRINEAIPSLWLLQGALGGEYFVAESFAISGEAGIRVVIGDSSYAEDIDPDITRRISASALMDHTFVSLGVTYYF